MYVHGWNFNMHALIVSKNIFEVYEEFNSTLISIIYKVNYYFLQLNQYQIIQCKGKKIWRLLKELMGQKKKKMKKEKIVSLE